MMRARSDQSPMVPELETPAQLREKCEQMQRQAPSLGLGFRKARLAPEIRARVLAHFQDNVARFRAEQRIEEIGTTGAGIIPTLLFEDRDFNRWLAEELRPLHEAWAGTPLELSYCYGIRCYQRGTYLHNHVDRQPHLVSATICVDHALDSPWPLHIESIDGEVSQVNLESGEFVQYEGARLAHGRPYPLDGDFYAGIFVHYRPTGWKAAAAGG
jgi:hypothetical protein